MAARVVQFILLCVLLCPAKVKSQDDDSVAVAPAGDDGKGFHLGVFIGTYLANKYTSGLYDGYGFDANGVRNTFTNSFLYNQIVNYYGGGYGGQDVIAQALGVNHNEWSFSESDMPINMHYTIAFLVGLNTRYNLNKKEAVILNVNATKLTLNGNFSINTISTNNGTQNMPMVHAFAITGAEQRLMFQLGYQKILGDNDVLNFFVEGGFNLTLSKFTKNQAYINGRTTNVLIDLMSMYNQAPYNYYRGKYLVGVGPGVFAGIGLNLDINPKYKVQLLYAPSYDRIKIGYDAQFRLQNSFGLRAYYNL